MRFSHRTALLAAVPLALAACSGGGGDAPSDISLVGTNGLAFEPAELSASAGTVQIELTAEDDSEHTVVVEELDDELVAAADGGETASGEVELAAGTYTLYCDVPGHRQAGMEATLTVED